MNESNLPDKGKSPKPTKLRPIYREGKLIGYSTNEPNIDYKPVQEMSKFLTVVHFIINRLTKN